MRVPAARAGPHGRLLVNGLRGGSQTGELAVVSADGKSLRVIPTTARPLPMSVAAYRRYDHR